MEDLKCVIIFLRLLVFVLRSATFVVSRLRLLYVLLLLTRFLFVLNLCVLLFLLGLCVLYILFDLDLDIS